VRADLRRVAGAHADVGDAQATKYELVINPKTAKTVGLIVPALLVARADDVIE
jgi:putative ABC transport system substrate-binding protein